MSQLQVVVETQGTPQIGRANQPSAQRGTIRSRASFLLPNGGNPSRNATPGAGSSQEQQGSGNGESNLFSSAVDYSAQWVNELPPEKRARIQEIHRHNQL